jgi:hypothetical protein
MPSLFETLRNKFHDLRRRLWGRYELDDPRPIAAEARYTYFLPAEEILDALAPGDEAKLLFRSVPYSRKWGAERMWVEVLSVGPDGLVGRLENVPTDMPQLKVGAEVAFQRWHVIDVILKENDRDIALGEPAREYWDRCLVDDCVLYDGVPVSYVYREEPDEPAEEDRFPDSGWRIRGDWRGLSDEEVEARKFSYVAVGAVLNRDDSWLSLIDLPVGARFLRDFEANTYIPEGEEPEDHS